MHLEDCPSGSVEEPLVVKVDISPKLDVVELDASGDVSEPDEEEPDIEEEDAEAKAPPPPQYSNESMGNSRS